MQSFTLPWLKRIHTPTSFTPVTLMVNTLKTIKWTFSISVLRFSIKERKKEKPFHVKTKENTSKVTSGTDASFVWYVATICRNISICRSDLKEHLKLESKLLSSSPWLPSKRRLFFRFFSPPAILTDCLIVSGVGH